MLTWESLPLCVSLLLLCWLNTVKSVHVPGETEWSYAGATGPRNWCRMTEKCCGVRQSPIDLSPSRANKAQTKELVLTNYDMVLRNMSIDNNGHTVDVFLVGDGVTPTLSGGGLPATYTFHSLHFHWGSNSRRGSEHTIDGKRFPIELHLVHVHSKFNGNIADAKNSNQSDALAVLGAFYELSASDNKDLDPVVEHIGEVMYADTKVLLANPFPLKNLLPSKVTSFYRYHGSLTTPDCNQVVAWTVFESTGKISEKQLERFRHALQTAVNETEPQSLNWIVNNNRPSQLLYGRPVYLMAAQL